MAQALATTDHHTIRQWVEERGGRPVTVEGTEGRGEEAGVLRIDFPGHGTDEGFRELSWEDFFEKFDASDLEFLYQEETAAGKPSRFCKLVHKDE